MAGNVIRQDIVEILFKSNSKDLQQITKEADKLKESLSGNLGSGIDGATEQTEKLKRSLNGLGNVSGFSKLERGFSRVSSAAKKLSSQVDSAADAITSKLFNLKSLVVGAIGGTVVKSAIDVVVDRQNLTSQFEVLLGSADKAKKRVEELTDFAGQTPFTRDEIFRASKQLQVFAGDAISTGDHLKVIGDVAAGTGESFEDVALWTGRLYTAMKGGQKVGEMTARLQEMGAISPEARDKIEALAKSGGDMGTKWAQVEKILGRFNGTMEKMSNNLGNMLLSLKSFATNNILLPLGEGIASGLQPAIQKFRQFRKTNKAEVERMGEILRRFGENICIPIFNSIESGVEGLIKIIGTMKTGVEDLDKLKGESAFMDGVINFLQFISRNKDTILDALQGIALIIGAIVLASKLKKLFETLKWLTTPLGMISTLALIAFMIFKKNGGTVQDIINGISKAIGWLKDNIKWLLPVVGALVTAFLAFKAVRFFKGLGKSGAGGGLIGEPKSGIMSLFEGFASVKISTVLKGMTNLAIVVGGLTLIARTVIPILYDLAKDSSLKLIVQSSLILLALGAVGTALSRFARTVSDIPINKVVKGLTNISLSLSAMGALIWVAKEVFKEDVNLKNISSLALLCGAFGVAGTAVSLLADIAAKISVRKVVKGLGNMAISLVGIGTLVWIATKVFSEGIDLKEMLKVAALCGVLGVLGSALSALAGIVGFIPIMTVLKGLANISIVLVGLGAIVWTATKVFKDGINLREMLKVVALIGVLGIVGTLLSALAGLVGFIPIMTVLKGLANIAIVIAGLGALVWTATKVFKDGINFSQMYKLIKLITVLGVVGSALSVLSGIIGFIPFEFVAMGLANIATTILGFGAIIYAFGALSDIPGFDDFITKGGDTLANLFAQIGKIAGSLVGGVGEGVSNSLPKIGDNIVDFGDKLGKFWENFGILGENLKKLMDAFNGVDVASVGTFFSELANFVLKMTANDFLSNITGGTDLVELGNNLSAFADSSKHFFETVAALPEGAITQASALFSALALIDELPESGGLLQAFSGDKIESLKALTTELPGIADGIQKFYENIGDRTDFSAISSLFNALASVKELPESGGFAQFFTGDSLKSMKTMVNNLPALADAVKVFFESLADIENFDKISALFNALASVKELPESGGFAQFFTGDPLESMKTMINNLPALGDAVKVFFESVADIENFDKISALFNALASVKELPESGGVLQFFTGDPLESMKTFAEKLPIFGDAVKVFFESVADIENFDKIPALFNALASVKELPESGGVLQFFTGDPLAGLKTMGEALPELGEGIKSFFENIGDRTDFSAINSLFNALASVKNLPEGNDIWTKIGDAVTGQETKSQLAVIGEDLKSFGENTKDFFEQVNNLNLIKLYGLWNGLKGAKSVSSDTFNVVSENVDKIVDKITKLPQQMADGIQSGGDALKESLVSIWVEAAKAMANPVNKVIEGANWILEQFGSDKRVASWTPYARGTDGHKGGNALVNDGRGAELVQMPNGNTFIPQGRNVFIPNAPKGMKVLPAEQTANMLGRNNPTFRYANGTGDIDIWSYMDDSKGLIKQIDKKFVNYDGLKGFPLHAGQSMVSMIEGEMTGWSDKLYDEMGAKSLASYVASAGVEQWRSTVIQALRMVGQYSQPNVERTLYQMQTESSGNPRAINLWDSNAKKGIPSKGLMQVIDPTFRAYAMPGHNSDIYDPLSNILASLRYAMARYGSLARAYRGKAYANGGIANKPSIFGEDGEEMAIPLSKDKRKRGLGLWAQAGKMLGVSLPKYTPEDGDVSSREEGTGSTTYSPVFNLTINGAEDSRSQARQVKKWIQEAIDEMFDSMERKSTVRQY